MDADVAALQRFTDVPYVIEAPASNPGLATAAAVALGSFDVKLDTSRGIPPARYQAVVEDVRRQIATDLGATKGWHVDVFDRTAKDLRKEGTRIDRTLSGFARSLKDGPGQGAFAIPFKGAAGKGCVLTGFPATLDVEEMLSEPVGEPVAMGNLTPEGFHKVALWHELGHCLLGSSEVRADTFAALMALRHGTVDKGALATLASYREMSEMTNPNPDDEYFISASLWQVVARADLLQANDKFMAMGTEEIAALAKAMVERNALKPDEVAAAKEVRRGILAAGSAETHTVVGADGRHHEATLREWVKANVGVPELARLTSVGRNLVEGARPLESFKVDLTAFRRSMSELAAKGDRTAARAVKAMSVTRRATRDEPDFAKIIPYGLPRPAIADEVDAMRLPGATGTVVRPLRVSASLGKGKGPALDESLPAYDEASAPTFGMR